VISGQWARGRAIGVAWLERRERGELRWARRGDLVIALRARGDDWSSFASPFFLSATSTSHA